MMFINLLTSPISLHSHFISFLRKNYMIWSVLRSPANLSWVKLRRHVLDLKCDIQNSFEVNDSISVEDSISKKSLLRRNYPTNTSLSCKLADFQLLDLSWVPCKEVWSLSGKQISKFIGYFKNLSQCPR